MRMDAVIDDDDGCDPTAEFNDDKVASPGSQGGGLGTFEVETSRAKPEQRPQLNRRGKPKTGAHEKSLLFSFLLCFLLLLFV